MLLYFRVHFLIFSAVNGALMARNGLILGQNEAYRLQEAFWAPPGPPGTHFRTKTDKKHTKSQNPENVPG